MSQTKRSLVMSVRFVNKDQDMTEFTGGLNRNVQIGDALELYADGQFQKTIYVDELHVVQHQKTSDPVEVIPAHMSAKILTSDSVFVYPQGVKLTLFSLQPVEAKAPRSHRPFYQKWWFWVCVTILLIFMIAALAPSPSTPSSHSSLSRSSLSQTTRPSSFWNSFTLSSPIDSGLCLYRSPC